MSKESTTTDLVNLQRSLLEALNRHDLDAMMSFFAPDAVWGVVALGTSFEGVTAIRGFSEECPPVPMRSSRSMPTPAIPRDRGPQRRDGEGGA